VERIPTTVADWRDIVETYSGLKLTYPSDSLPALLGPAMDMQPRREGTYLAGMWTDSIIEDLTWHVPSFLLDNGYPRLKPPSLHPPGYGPRSTWVRWPTAAAGDPVNTYRSLVGGHASDTYDPSDPLLFG
jgi:hypothetical protein